MKPGREKNSNKQTHQVQIPWYFDVMTHTIQVYQTINKAPNVNVHVEILETTACSGMNRKSETWIDKQKTVFFTNVEWYHAIKHF